MRLFGRGRTTVQQPRSFMVIHPQTTETDEDGDGTEVIAHTSKSVASASKASIADEATILTENRSGRASTRATVTSEARDGSDSGLRMRLAGKRKSTSPARRATAKSMERTSLFSKKGKSKSNKASKKQRSASPRRTRQSSPRRVKNKRAQSPMRKSKYSRGRSTTRKTFVRLGGKSPTKHRSKSVPPTRRYRRRKPRKPTSLASTDEVYPDFHAKRQQPVKPNLAEPETNSMTVIHEKEEPAVGFVAQQPSFSFFAFLRSLIMSCYKPSM